VGVLCYERDGVTVVLNAGEEPAPLPQGEVLLASGPLGADGTLPVDTAVWIR
jgi:alpha-glucosidase